MRNLIKKIISSLKKKNRRDFQYLDNYRICIKDPKGLGDYCRIEGYNSR